MMKKRLAAAVLLCMFVTGTLAQEPPRAAGGSQASEGQAAATLRLGDPAPPLKVRWIKGEKPVDFKDGQVHVLEFWATWCGPCKRNMPHMSELARKYRGKVEVISVSIWERPKDENTPYEPEVIDFVHHAGDMMDHPVAVDTTDGFMGTHWVRASGQNGIPAAVLVDRQGKVAWTGTAFGGLDEAIELALKDKLDAAAAARTKENYRAGMKARGELQAAANAALKDGKADDAIRLANQASTAVPVFANSGSQWVLLYRAHKLKGQEAAAAFVDKIAREHSTAPIDLQQLASAVVDDDPAGALKLLQAGSRHTRPTDPGMSMALAKAYALTGDYVNAIAAQGNALNGLRTLALNPQVQQTIDAETAQLREYVAKFASTGKN